jgi:ADP-glucose pyrophosphorylase
MKLAIIILAGGRGSRVGSLADASKPMLFFKGRPIISYALELASKLPYLIFVITSIHTADCRRYLNSSWPGIVNLFERRPRGVVNIINQLPDLIDADHFLILPCDHYINYSLSEFIAFHFAKEANISVAASPIQNQATTIWYLQNLGELIADNSDTDDVVTAYGVGTYIMSRKALESFSKISFSVDSVSFMIKRVMNHDITAYAYLTTGFWFDLGQGPDGIKVCDGMVNCLLTERTTLGALSHPAPYS